MSEETQCPNCGRPVADGSLSCSSCVYDIGDRQEGSDPPEPAAPDLDAHERRSLGGEGRRLHPVSPLVFAVVGVIVGLLAALAAGPELGVALGLLGGGLGVWALMRSGILR